MEIKHLCKKVTFREHFLLIQNKRFLIKFNCT